MILYTVSTYQTACLLLSTCFKLCDYLRPYINILGIGTDNTNCRLKMEFTYVHIDKKNKYIELIMLMNGVEYKKEKTVVELFNLRIMEIMPLAFSRF